MPVDPVEAWLDACARAPGGEERRERHLDAHPLPVDEAEVLAATARLRARVDAELRREPRLRPVQAARRPWVAVGAALAAAALLAARVGAPVHTGPIAAEPAPGIRWIAPRPPPGVEASVEAGPSDATRAPASTVSLADDRTAVVLVTEGAIRAPDGREVPAGHWLITAIGDGTSETLIVPDGVRPDLADPAWAATDVDRQLRAVRVRVIPERTRQVWDAIIEEDEP